MASNDEQPLTGQALPRFLINLDGAPFADLADIEQALDILDNEHRMKFRDDNAVAIAECRADRMLIVAGLGAGKSYLFMSRI